MYKLQFSNLSRKLVCFTLLFFSDVEQHEFPHNSVYDQNFMMEEGAVDGEGGGLGGR